MILKKFLAMVMCLAVILSMMAGCQSAEPAATEAAPAATEAPATEAPATEAAEEKGELIMAGTAAIITLVEPYLTEMGYDVEVMAFSGIPEAANAMNDGLVDCVIANNCQWVITYAKTNNADIMTVEPHLFSPLRAMYSLKHETHDEIPEGGTIVIAADSANQQRDLQHMEHFGLITLADAPTTGEYFTVYDIVENPKNLEILTVDHSTAQNYLEDAAAVICGARNVQKMGHDILDYLSEDPFSANYTHGLMVQSENQDAPWVEDILAVWQNPDFKEDFNAEWQGSYRLLPLEN